jgi:hypothetical protein
MRRHNRTTNDAEKHFSILWVVGRDGNGKLFGGRLTGRRSGGPSLGPHAVEHQKSAYRTVPLEYLPVSFFWTGLAFLFFFGFTIRGHY